MKSKARMSEGADSHRNKSVNLKAKGRETTLSQRMRLKSLQLKVKIPTNPMNLGSLTMFYVAAKPGRILTDKTDYVQLGERKKVVIKWSVSTKKGLSNIAKGDINGEIREDSRKNEKELVERGRDEMKGVDV